MIELRQLILFGRIGSLASSATVEDVVNYLGQPDFHTPPRKTSPEILLYDNLEFRFRANQLKVITLTFRRGSICCGIPVASEGLVRDATIAYSDVVELLDEERVRLQRDLQMSDETQDVLVTERGVHLVFVNEKLVKIGVTRA